MKKTHIRMEEPYQELEYLFVFVLFASIWSRWKNKKITQPGFPGLDTGEAKKPAVGKRRATYRRACRGGWERRTSR